MTIRIVLVDDSDIALAWAREKLTTHDFEVLTYQEPFGIQAFVRRSRPDVVLLDVNMPALQGDMVCKLLKQHPSTKKVTVALYSSMAEDELKALTVHCLADGYILKTEDDALLARQIHALVKGKSK